MSLVNANTNIKWASIAFLNNDASVQYVGVTPGKSYTLKLSKIDSISTVSAIIYYSTEINTHTPDVTDY